MFRRVAYFASLRWLGEEVADCYCADNGRPGIDPEVAVRLLLAGLLLGIVHDRRLMREAQVNIAIRWFIGYGLHERLPGHSSLTRIRQRWGEERFREIFKRTVTACLEARIATAEVVHIDASLIRANVRWDSLAERHAGKVVTENDGDRETEAKRQRGRRRGPSRKVRRTDPDAGAKHLSGETKGVHLYSAGRLCEKVGPPQTRVAGCVRDNLPSSLRTKGPPASSCTK